MAHKNALIWAKVFLQKETFSSFKGDTIAFALLYPMEKLFENYVEYYLRNEDENKTHQIIPQSSRNFVKNLFSLKPDFLIKKDDEILVVADAKWKIIDATNNDKNKTFSQSDFYQLYAYSKVFNDKNTQLRLYYPRNENFKKNKCYKYWDNTEITVIPLDLNKICKNYHNQT